MRLKYEVVKGLCQLMTKTCIKIRDTKNILVNLKRVIDFSYSSLFHYFKYIIFYIFYIINKNIYFINDYSFNDFINNWYISSDNECGNF